MKSAFADRWNMKKISFVLTAAFLTLTLSAPALVQAQGSILPTNTQQDAEKPKKTSWLRATVSKNKNKQAAPQAQLATPLISEQDKKNFNIKKIVPKPAKWFRASKEDVAQQQQAYTGKANDAYIKNMPGPKRQKAKALSEYYFRPYKSLFLIATTGMLGYAFLNVNTFASAMEWQPITEWMKVGVGASGLVSAVGACVTSLRSFWSVARMSALGLKTSIQNDAKNSRFEKGLKQFTADYNYIKKQSMKDKNLNERKARSLDKHKYMHGYSLLHMAVATGDTHMLNYMLDQGHQINEVDDHGHMPIDMAAHMPFAYGYKKILELNGFRLEFYPYQDTTPRKWYQKKDERAGLSTHSPLKHLSVLRDQVKGMEMFLERTNHSADFSDNSDYRERLQYLSKRKAKKEARRMSQMLATAQALVVKQEHIGLDHYDVPKTRRKAKPASLDKQTALAFQHFFNEGLPINAYDQNGDTLLHTAVMVGNWEAAQFFLNSRASSHIKNRQGLSPDLIVRLKLEGFEDIYTYIVKAHPTAPQQYPEVAQMGEAIARIKQLLPSDPQVDNELAQARPLTPSVDADYQKAAGFARQQEAEAAEQARIEAQEAHDKAVEAAVKQKAAEERIRQQEEQQQAEVARQKADQRLSPQQAQQAAEAERQKLADEMAKRRNFEEAPTRQLEVKQPAASSAGKVITVNANSSAAERAQLQGNLTSENCISLLEKDDKGVHLEVEAR